MSAKPSTSQVWAVVSDVHIPHHNQKSWLAFKAWVADTKPYGIIVNGDFFDFEAVGSYSKNADSMPNIIDEMKAGIKELNWLRSIAKRVVFLPGNHEARYERRINEALQTAGKGLKGLTLHDQLVAQGLNKSIEFVKESARNIGFRLAQFIVRHGDKQAGRSSTAKHVAYNRIVKTMGASEIVGHHHVAQLYCMAFDDRLAISVANPAITEPHEYAPGASWQTGFTILDVAGQWATPLVVVMHKGQFSLGGKVYKG